MAFQIVEPMLNITRILIRAYVHYVETESMPKLDWRYKLNLG